MTIKTSLIASCRRILAPLTRILIRFGIGAGELNALIEQEYVKSAVRQLAHTGELVTASRIAIITGLPRNIVASIVESLDEESTRRVQSLIQRAQRVLTGWYEDREFQTRDGDRARWRYRGPVTRSRASWNGMWVVAFVRAACSRNSWQPAR